MDEKRKEYLRKWRHENKEKIREYRRNTMLRSAMRDLEDGVVSLVGRSRLEVVKKQVIQEP